MATAESALLSAGLPNLFTPEYHRFAAKWDVVKSPFSPNHWYWSGSRQRWEWVSPDQFSVTDVGLDVVDEDRDQGAIWIFGPVQKSWDRVRVAQPDAIWNPRNGGWFVWKRLPGSNPTTPAPPEPPQPPPKVWTERMNEELTEIDKLALSPAEKQRARDAVRERYVGS
jgi:hypothetical protein